MLLRRHSRGEYLRAGPAPGSGRLEVRPRQQVVEVLELRALLVLHAPVLEEALLVLKARGLLRRAQRAHACPGL
eukprot:1521821-Lingulodinium_polyedra.AAC.1